jgi:hypothetical protein
MCLANDSVMPTDGMSSPTEPLKAPIEQSEPCDRETHETAGRPRRATRRVSFQVEEIINEVDPASRMTESERNRLWYPADELLGFKTEARETCRKMRHPTDDMTEPEQSVLVEEEIDENEDSLRGLEHRISLERQKNKYVSIQVVLKAQERFPDDPDRLARIASRITEWAKDVALQSARRDFAVVYDPSSVNKVPATTVSFPQIPLHDTKKRHRDQLVVSPITVPRSNKRPRLIPPEMRQHE